MFARSYWFALDTYALAPVYKYGMCLPALTYPLACSRWPTPLLTTLVWRHSWRHFLQSTPVLTTRLTTVLITNAPLLSRTNSITDTLTYRSTGYVDTYVRRQFRPTTLVNTPVG